MHVYPCPDLDCPECEATSYERADAMVSEQLAEQDMEAEEGAGVTERLLRLVDAAQKMVDVLTTRPNVRRTRDDWGYDDCEGFSITDTHSGAYDACEALRAAIAFATS